MTSPSPPPKKRRMERHVALAPENGDSARDGSDGDFTLVPVLAESVTRVLPVKRALVARISDRRQTAALVHWLAAHLPVPALAHLKRVKTVRQDGAAALFVLVDLLQNVFPSSTPADGEVERPESAPSSNPAPVPLGRSLSELESVLAGRGVASRPPGLCPELFTAAVAAARPVTRRQYDQAAVLWPTVFHRDLRVEASLAPPAAAPAERRRLAGWMAAAARAAAGSAGRPRVGCVIVDPAADRLVAAAADARGDHALQHAVMRAVDAVAAAQGGGAWSCAPPPPADPSEPPSEPSEPPTDRPPPPDALPSALPYLCTGYDAFVTREPCVMCAMALLHSRIGRVFYARPRPAGALGSSCKLHVAEGLNHRFQVFAGLGAEQCRGLEDGERKDGSSGQGS